MEQSELPLLFKTPKEIVSNAKIDEDIMETLREFDWFGTKERDEFIERHKINMNNKALKYNEKITNAQNKMFGLLEAECVSRNLDENTKKILIKVGQYLLERNDLNYFENPLFENAEYYQDMHNGKDYCGDVSEDCGGYNGENGKMNCWKLEENSRTSQNEISLHDAIFDKESWDTSDYTKQDIDMMILVGQIFCDIGFDVISFIISVWRCGYDYDCTRFEKNNIGKITTKFVDNIKMFRIYISKKY